MYKGTIGIFILPNEIDQLQQTLFNLHKNLLMIEDDFELTVDINYCPFLTNWKKSSIPKKYFTDKLNHVCKTYLNPLKIKYNIISNDKSILGVASYRRKLWLDNQDIDFFVWLDSDIIFGDYVLRSMLKGYKSLINNNLDKFIISPECIKLGDYTWDVLVNEKYMSKQYNYQKSLNHNPILSSLNYGEITLQELNYSKFGGGWFNLLTKPLLDNTTVPEKLGHYGLEDTYIMSCINISKQIESKKLYHFKLENIIVCENDNYETRTYYNNYLDNIDRKKEFMDIAEINFDVCVKEYIKKIVIPQNSI